ncbi:MAG: hypothetical protein UW11_C0039G0008 [Parcubacteria group bacterium GW2011_GWA2_43_9b]|uniref:C2H2-type domain-containing protein n=1 Tax=Candidatus Portnoybacteria bacterium RIFCSPLOWO2_02_FULL_39_11 TaxID=1802001 RepID=A0A1G2FR03_9BACT|nr:MAG: hypothetical protein UW11_C0039G0008 [Parcubacteria group bacterium GW2011_GWA2_43_9b]OGZ40050.1 MAG: hypothetical protein A3B04_03535 [Candidatus Portnoybacteria bacterium RIFCSPLOWO2_02_FULL_39_11]
MGRHDTTASKVATNELLGTKRKIQQFQGYLKGLDGDIERHEKYHIHKREPYSTDCCNEMMLRTFSIFEHISKHNGAVAIIREIERLKSLKNRNRCA